jgi:hypothetical protein
MLSVSCWEAVSKCLADNLSTMILWRGLFAIALTKYIFLHTERFCMTLETTLNDMNPMTEMALMKSLFIQSEGRDTTLSWLWHNYLVNPYYKS